VSVPVTVVTGFLGAGKTTLLNRWLGETPPGAIAVIVNEVGAVGIDGSLLASGAPKLVEIAGGCVCCRTQAELVATLASLAAQRPARILVETSGAASPAGVIRAITKQAECHLDGIITVVDDRQLVDPPDLAIEQIGYADVVVARAAESFERIATWNGSAFLTLSAPLNDLLAHRTELPRITPATAKHDAYESISLAFDGAVDGERFADFMETSLARFASRLFRVKGILAVDDVAERMIVQGVADEVEVTFGEPWGGEKRISRLVIVGFGLDRASIEGAFERAKRR
jgi:G3E family GTPase